MDRGLGLAVVVQDKPHVSDVIGGTIVRPKPQKSVSLILIGAEKVAITIAAIRNMLDMARAHEALERRSLRRKKTSNMLPRLRIMMSARR